MTLLHSVSVPIGSPIIDFFLPGTDGKTYSVESFADKKVLVFVFTCNHCPYANAIEDRLIEFQEKYADQGVQVIAINSNDAENYPDDSYEKMVERAKEKNYPFIYLYDESQEVAHAYQTQCTPDLYVYDENRELAYHGRFDDNWQNPNAVTSHDLKETVKALLAGEEPNPEQHPSMGCSIKWKKD